MRFRFCALVVVLLFATPGAGADWSRFRGPNGSGVADASSVPLEWSSEKNLQYRIELPGSGTSSPIIVGNKVMLTCYTGYGVDPQEPGEPDQLVRHLMAYDRATGNQLWRKSVPANGDEDPYQGFITQHGYASSTPTSDGERVYVLFGKSGLYCYDLEGNGLWHQNLGQKSDPAKWGDGTSPILVDDLVVVNAAILGNQFIALDKVSGEVRWQIEDASFTNCWSTPTVARTESGNQILFQVPKQVFGVDPSTGERLWEAESPLDDATCASIVTDGTRAFLMGSRMGNGLGLSLQDGGADVLWQKSIRSGIDTPLLIDNRLYWQSNGIFMAADASTGEYLYRERLPSTGDATTFPNVDYSSPVAVGDKIIVFVRNGESFVIQAGDEFELVHHNPAFQNDPSAFSGTPAIGSDDLFVRSANYLYRIAK